MISNVWYVPKFKQNLLSLVMIRQAGHMVIMEDGLVKINSVKQNMKKMMIGYEDGKLLRMKGQLFQEIMTLQEQQVQNFTDQNVACNIWPSQLRKSLSVTKTRNC